MSPERIAALVVVAARAVFWAIAVAWAVAAALLWRAGETGLALASTGATGLHTVYFARSFRSGFFGKHGP